MNFIIKQYYLTLTIQTKSGMILIILLIRKDLVPILKKYHQPSSIANHLNNYFCNLTIFALFSLSFDYTSL